MTEIISTFHELGRKNFLSDMDGYNVDIAPGGYKRKKQITIPNPGMQGGYESKKQANTPSRRANRGYERIKQANTPSHCADRGYIRTKQVTIPNPGMQGGYKRTKQANTPSRRAGRGYISTKQTTIPNRYTSTATSQPSHPQCHIISHPTTLQHPSPGGHAMFQATVLTH